MERVLVLFLVLIVISVSKSVVVKRVTAQKKGPLRNLLFWNVEDRPECVPSKCPKPRGKEWRRLQKLCCPDHTGLLHCQLDEDGKIQMMCIDPPELCPPGKFASLSAVAAVARGSLCKTCVLSEFQPVAKYSYEFLRPACEMNRTVCEDYNAFTIERRNASLDDVCICDPLKGFRAVNVARPDYNCSTFNASSGCSCIYQPCPEGLFLNPTDYRCIEFEDLTEEYTEWQIQYLRRMKNTLNGQIDSLIELIDETRKNRELLKQMYKLLRRWNPTEIKEKEMGQDKPDPPLRTFVCAAVVTCISLSTAAVVCYRGFMKTCNTKSQPREKETLIRVSFTSRKAADVVYSEVKNILPMLSRHYGHLSLMCDIRERYFSIVVRPRGATPFRLLHFIRDLLSPETIKRVIAECSMVPGNEVNIFVWHRPCPDAKLAHLESLPPTKASTVGCDAGEIVLKFSKTDEQYLLKKLRSARDSLRVIFAKHQLDFKNVRSGSIIFRFHLTNSSRTFDDLAIDRKTLDFMKELVSHEAFRNLATEQQVKVEFFCKARLENVTVVQAQNVILQIGEQNNVYICDQDPASSCEHLHAERVNNVMVSDENGTQYAIGEMLKVNTVNVSFRQSAVASQLDVEESWVQNNGEQGNVVWILVRCHTSEASRILRTQWSNLLPLLRNHYPGCEMKHSGKRIFWTLLIRDNRTPDICTAFLTDIFSIERVKYVAMESTPRVDIVFPDCMAARLAFWERGSVFVRRLMETLLIRLNFMVYVSFNVSVFWGLVAFFVGIVVTLLAVQTANKVMCFWA